MAQAQQQPSLGVSESSTSVRSGKATPKASSRFNVQKWLVSNSNGRPLAKKPYLETIFEDHQDSMKLSSHASGSSTNFKKGSHRRWHF